MALPMPMEEFPGITRHNRFNSLIGRFGDFTKASFLYIFVAALVVAPPRPFVELGWTVEGVFSGFVGKEIDHFTHHHIRRSYATLLTHSCLLVGYTVLVWWFLGDACFTQPADGWVSLAGVRVAAWWAALAAGVAGVGVAEWWHASGWRHHPVVVKLSQYPGGWRDAADSIAAEFRRMDKVYVKLGFQAVLVTDRWIVRVGMYGLDIAAQHDADLSIVASQTVTSMEDPDDSGQILSIRVTSLNQPPFTIRMSAINYHDIDARVLRPVRNMRGIVVERSLEEEFLEVLQEHVGAADKFALPPGEALDRCVGCMSSEADIKVRSCRCRPMWCLACLGKWFANSQRQDRPETWLEGEGECPTCRSKFNVSDLARAVANPRAQTSPSAAS